MRKLQMFSIFAGLLLLAQCSVIDQNLQARKNLANCKYELEKIELNRIDFKDIIVPKSVWFDVFLKITNTAASDVVLDRVEADVYLDSKKLTEIAHKNFVKIKPQASIVEKLAVEIGADAIISAVANRPKNITLKAKVWVNILIGSFTLKTPIAITVEKTFPIPYDKIELEIQKKKDSVKNAIPTDVKGVKNKLKKMF